MNSVGGPLSFLQSCCRRLYNWLKVSPYRPDQQVEEDDDLMDESQGKGIRVLGVAYAPSRYGPHVSPPYVLVLQLELFVLTTERYTARVKPRRCLLHN